MVIEKDMTRLSIANMRKRFRYHTYIHPETGEVFKELREDSDMDRPYKASDGMMCSRKPRPGEKKAGTPIIRSSKEPPLKPVHIKF